MSELPRIILMYYADSKGVVRTKSTKELIRELITNYNELIEYLSETGIQDEPDNQ
jgi:hypothetical protein